jgi:hypothetical protein
MTNYVFVYYNEAVTEPSTEEGKAAWGAWFGSIGEKLVDGGNQFNGGGMAVEKSGVAKIENYPATGYTIVKAASMEEATEIAKGCPVLDAPGGAIRVYETLPM